MKNEKPVTFACFAENHLIERVWFVRLATANAQHMAENFIKNYRRLVSALDVAKTCCMVTKKVVLSVGQNQPKLRQRNVLLTLKNTMNGKKYGEKHDMKKTRQMAYAHDVAREKQIRGIPLAHFAGKQREEHTLKCLKEPADMNKDYVFSATIR